MITRTDIADSISRLWSDRYYQELLATDSLWRSMAEQRQRVVMSEFKKHLAKANEYAELAGKSRFFKKWYYIAKCTRQFMLAARLLNKMKG